VKFGSGIPRYRATLPLGRKKADPEFQRIVLPVEIHFMAFMTFASIEISLYLGRSEAYDRKQENFRYNPQIAGISYHFEITLPVGRQNFFARKPIFQRAIHRMLIEIPANSGFLVRPPNYICKP